MDSTVVTSMQGVIGFKTYYSVTTAPFRKFEVKFRRKFRAEYPEEDSSRPSVFALRAYDAIQTIAKSAKMLQEKNYSKTLIQHILSSDFDGLSGRIQFKNYKLSEVPVFQIVNTVGPVYWPDGRTLVPRGLAETDIGEERRTTLRIAVPATSMFKHTQLIYDMVPFHGSYDEMVTAVSEKVEVHKSLPISLYLMFRKNQILFKISDEGESLRSQSSRLLLLPWFFLILIVTSTYTANLTSMLQAPPSTPSAIDITLLRSTNAAVGFDGNSFTLWYLEKGFEFQGREHQKN
ncbi:hypothetical protein OIU76_024603 [Salix suchowensis]|nr:hypothetical protein OIU76_024603 [Salix suchowensis]